MRDGGRSFPAAAPLPSRWPSPPRPPASQPRRLRPPGRLCGSLINGAGATFPYPPLQPLVLRVCLRRHHGQVQLPVHRLRRRHQADHGQDRGLRRLRCDPERDRTTRRSPRPAADAAHRGRRGGPDLQREGARRARPAGARRPALADIFLGKITKWNDPAIAALNPGRDAAEQGHHRRPPLRRLGHDLHLHRLPVRGQPGMEDQGRRRTPRSSGRLAWAARAMRAWPARSARTTAPSATSSWPTPSRTSIAYRQHEERGRHGRSTPPPGSTQNAMNDFGGADAREPGPLAS